MGNNDEVKLIGKMLMSHNGSIFVEKGKFGIKGTDENILVPAKYDQIEKCVKYIYILKDGYLTLYSARSIRSWNIQNQDDGYVYAECGKLGWKEQTGKILIPAAYDEIHRWGKSLYAVQNGNRWFYINDRQEEVLTDFTLIDGEDAENPPFELSASSNKVLTILEYVGHEDENDSNVVTLDDMWVRMKRMAGEEIARLLVNPDDEYPMTEKDLALYNNSFSYEFNAYVMHSTKEKGVCDCMRQAYKLNAYSNSWYYLIKVWKAPGEEPTAEELRAIRYYTDKKQRIGQLKFSLGHDNLLKPGETKMLMVTHYNERCFPPAIEFNWTDFLNEQSLDIIKANIPELRKIVEETYQPEYIDEVWWDMLHDRINGINYFADRTWEETEKVLDYFKKDDTAYLHGVLWVVERFMDCDTFKEDPYFYINKLKWLLNNGANVNTFKESETGLDLLNNSPRTFLNDHPVDDNVISECKMLMIQNGALTMEELREKEALNNDYLIELRRMSL